MFCCSFGGVLSWWLGGVVLARWAQLLLCFTTKHTPQTAKCCTRGRLETSRCAHPCAWPQCIAVACTHSPPAAIYSTSFCDSFCDAGMVKYTDIDSNAPFSVALAQYYPPASYIVSIGACAGAYQCVRSCLSDSAVSAQLPFQE